MSLLEAIQFDKPILTSNIEPMNEFCKEMPVYIDPNDSKSITNAIVYYLKMSPFEKKLFNYNKIKKDLSWDIFTKKIIEIYELESD